MMRPAFYIIEFSEPNYGKVLVDSGWGGISLLYLEEKSKINLTSA